MKHEPMRHEGFTPGPWTENGFAISGPDPVHGAVWVASVRAGSRSEANIRLIAAAPALLARVAELETLLRLAEIDLASFVRQDSTTLLGDIRAALSAKR